MPVLIDEKTKSQFRAARHRVAALTVPELIEFLESPRLVVRLAAEMRLRELAGL